MPVRHDPRQWIATGNYEVPMLAVGALVLLAGALVPVAARAAGPRRQWRLESGAT